MREKAEIVPSIALSIHSLTDGISRATNGKLEYFFFLFVSRMFGWDFSRNDGHRRAVSIAEALIIMRLLSVDELHKLSNFRSLVFDRALLNPCFDSSDFVVR